MLKTNNVNNKHMISLAVMSIILAGILSNIHIQNQIISSIDDNINPGVAILSIGTDNAVEIAKITLLKSIERVDNVKTSIDRASIHSCSDEIALISHSWILVIIGHGTPEGLQSETNVLLWDSLSDSLKFRNAPTIILACYSAAANTPDGKVWGFSGKIDAEAGALFVSAVSLSMLGKIDDTSNEFTNILTLAAHKQIELSNPLVSNVRVVGSMYFNTWEEAWDACWTHGNALHDLAFDLIDERYWDHGTPYAYRGTEITWGPEPDQTIAAGVIGQEPVFHNIWGVFYRVGDEPASGRDPLGWPILPPDKDPEDYFNELDPIVSDPEARIDPADTPEENADGVIADVSTTLSQLYSVIEPWLPLILIAIAVGLILFCASNGWNPLTWILSWKAAEVALLLIAFAVALQLPVQSTYAFTSIEDHDLDGLLEETEYLIGTSDYDSDSDNDGFNDLEEVTHSWDPLDNLSPIDITIDSQPSSTSSSRHSFWVYTPTTNRLKVYDNAGYIGYWIPSGDWCEIDVTLESQAYNTIKVEAFHATDDLEWSSMVNYVQFTIYCSYSGSSGGGGGGGSDPPPSNDP